MRIKDINDVSKFDNYKKFGATEVLVDCIGPLIDISQIKSFREIEDVRYLSEAEIIDKMPRQKGVELSWTNSDIRDITKKALRHPKLAVRHVDTEMVRQLCKAKTFCSIKIVSTVEDPELFNLAKQVLINYSIQMAKYNRSIGEGYEALEDSDFEHIVSAETQLPGILLYYRNRNRLEQQESYCYRVAIDDDTLVFGTLSDDDDDIPSFQEWIGGIQEKEPLKRLEAVLCKRNHIYNGTDAISNMCEGGVIKLNKYTIMDNYYVYDDNLREQLNKRINAIKHIIEIGKAKTKPICVFLAGTPGTGKSYFVKCFADSMKCDKHYPVTSLSGVSSDNFYSAIEHHVEQVYNAKFNDDYDAAIAFLDEIDTACGYFAFRFLMDAMTGSRTNDIGETMESFKSGTVENLIWFFAGSAGSTRQEFMNQIKTDERKVIDFFDRIHFDMQLPDVETPGQAILTLMSAIKTYWAKDKLPKQISIKVLLAFACTQWTSTRSIMTICRVAAAAHEDADSDADIDSDVITLELFEGIDTSEEFHKQCAYIGAHVTDEKLVTIEWE